MVVRRPEPSLFPAAVGSVLWQTRPDLELVVVETGSDRPAEPMLRAVRDPRVRHVLVPPDTPLARARNVAWRAARADKIAILDADDIASPQRVAMQARFLDANPDVGVVGSAIMVMDVHGSQLGWRRYPKDDAAVRRAMRRWNPLAQPAVMLRRSTLEHVGGYRERDGGICEDYDLWCRMARAGVRFANLDEPLTCYRLHPGSMKSVHLRGTLRDTIRIKRECFAGDLDLGDRLRILGERALMLLPASLVQRLFLRHAVTERS